jgi:hypothetical protein
MRRSGSMLFALLVALSLSSPASATPGQRAWVSLINGSGGPSSVDEALRVATTSNGGRIFAAGLEEDAVTVVAYRYGGTVAWRAHYRPPGRFTATYVENIVVAANDREVVVTAPLIGPYKDPMAVVAFDAMTGHLDWSWLSTRSGSPQGLAAGPGRVVVAGSEGRSRDTDWLVAALRPLTGQVVWTKEYDDPLGHADPAGVIIDRGRVFVTGSVATRDASTLRTIAYAARDGSRIWTDSFGRRGFGEPVGVSGDGSTLVVEAGWTIVEYDPRTGARTRVERHRAAWKGQIIDVTIDHRGTTVYFTGTREPGQGFTTAYDLRSGNRRWRAPFGTSGTVAVVAVPSSPAQVVVTGYREVDSAYAWKTVAYSAGTGRRLWSDLYRGPLHEQGFPRAIAAAPAGTRVYVVGYATTKHSDDFATIALVTA